MGRSSAARKGPSRWKSRGVRSAASSASAADGRVSSASLPCSHIYCHRKSKENPKPNTTPAKEEPRHGVFTCEPWGFIIVITNIIVIISIIVIIIVFFFFIFVVIINIIKINSISISATVVSIIIVIIAGVITTMVTTSLIHATAVLSTSSVTIKLLLSILLNGF